MATENQESHLLIIQDDQGRKEFTLQQTIYSLGRGRDCNIRLISQFVSRRHATLVRMPKTQKGNSTNNYYYRIVDGDATGKPSANGIIINGRKTSVHNLKNEDEIVFGPTVRAIYYDNCKKKITGNKGYPKFQKDNRSVEYKTSGWKLNPNKRRITITDKKGIGELKLLGKWDIHTYPVKSIKRLRLVRRADGYYCQFCVDVEVKDIQPLTGNEIGLDVGIESFYTDSSGHQEPNPRFLRKIEPTIKHAQRRIYKKKKGSNGRRKARAIFARKHLRISRQRNEHAKRIAVRFVG